MLLGLGDTLDLMDPRLVLQVLVDILTFDRQDTFLAASVDTHILLELELANLEPHQATVTLIHLEEIFSK